MWIRGEEMKMEYDDLQALRITISRAVIKCPAWLHDLLATIAYETHTVDWLPDKRAIGPAATSDRYR